MKTFRNLSLALALLLPSLTLAAPNEGVMTYSGILKNALGNAESSPQTLKFTIYNDPINVAGAILWSQTVNGVQADAQGWFSVVLGAPPALALPSEQFLNQTWLGIQVGTEAEMTPRTKVGVAPHALSVDHGGLSGCAAASQVLQWNGTAWTCINTPAGGGGGVTGVTATAPLSSSGGTAPVISMGMAGASASGYLSSTDWTAFSSKPAAPGAVCLAGTVLTWTGTGFACVVDQVGSGTVTAVAVAAGTPITVTNSTTVPTLRMSYASDGTGNPGYITAADFINFSGKAPSPAAACGTGQVLSWNGSAFTCVAAPGGGVAAYSNTAPVPFGSGATYAVAASVTFTLAVASKVLVLGDVFLWGQGAACNGMTRITVDGVVDQTTLTSINVPAVVSGNNGGSVATSLMINSLAAGAHTISLDTATNTGMCNLAKSPHVNAIALN
jgi:hypothetical protein